MKTQKFGIEIELTGITRKKAADVIAEYFGTEKFYIGTYYQTYGAKDRKGRTWKATFDSSIIAQRKKGGRREPASEEYKCEIVSPILEYEDLEDLQEIVRQLRHKGAFASDQCGIQIMPALRSKKSSSRPSRAGNSRMKTLCSNPQSPKRQKA